MKTKAQNQSGAAQAEGLRNEKLNTSAKRIQKVSTRKRIQKTTTMKTEIKAQPKTIIPSISKTTFANGTSFIENRALAVNLADLEKLGTYSVSEYEESTWKSPEFLAQRYDNLGDYLAAVADETELKARKRRKRKLAQVGRRMERIHKEDTAKRQAFARWESDPIGFLYGSELMGRTRIGIMDTVAAKVFNAKAKHLGKMGKNILLYRIQILDAAKEGAAYGLGLFAAKCKAWGVRILKTDTTGSAFASEIVRRYLSETTLPSGRIVKGKLPRALWREAFKQADAALSRMAKMDTPEDSGFWDRCVSETDDGKRMQDESAALREIECIQNYHTHRISDGILSGKVTGKTLALALEAARFVERGADMLKASVSGNKIHIAETLTWHRLVYRKDGYDANGVHRYKGEEGGTTTRSALIKKYKKLASFMGISFLDTSSNRCDYLASKANRKRLRDEMREAVFATEKMIEEKRKEKLDTARKGKEKEKSFGVSLDIPESAKPKPKVTKLKLYSGTGYYGIACKVAEAERETVWKMSIRKRLTKREKFLASLGRPLSEAEREAGL